MTSQASMWKLGEVRSNAKGGNLCLEPLFWQSEASLEIPWEPRAFSEGQRPSFATDERARLFWERAETDLVEQLAAASERVFDAKLTPEAVRQRLLPSVRQSRGGDWMLKAKLPAHARFWNAGGTFADRPAELAHSAARVRLRARSLWLMSGMCGLSLICVWSHLLESARCDFFRCRSLFSLSKKIQNGHPRPGAPRAAEVCAEGRR